jgi:hypothetical protein
MAAGSLAGGGRLAKVFRPTGACRAYFLRRIV